MAFSKQCNDSSEWEGALATKRPRASQESEKAELQHDQDNYGTLSSQRPTRDRKHPVRYIDLPSQPARKKAKTSPKKGSTTPKSTPSPRKSASTPKRRPQQVASTGSQDPATTPTHQTPQVPEKKSAIVRLKVPLGSTVPTTPPRRSFSDGQQSDLDSVFSSPPESLAAQSPVSPIMFPR
jgi:hypothetical protein